MGTILPQILAAVILGTGIGLAYLKWVGPLGNLVNRQNLGALLLALLALIGGFVGSWFWWVDEPRSFAWDLPPLAARMLASAGWSFFVLCLVALQRPTFRRMRLVMLNLFVYLVPLAVAIVLFHLDRFDTAAPITYTFFATALVMAAASTWYLFRPVRVLPDTRQDAQLTNPMVRSWLLLIAVLVGVWGLALFITDRGPSDLIWVWPGDLLSSRLIGVMLLTIASGSLYSLRFADSAKHMLSMTMMYSLGLSVASFWNVLAGKPVKFAYLVVFGVIFLVSIAIQPLQRRAAQEQAG